MGYHCRCLLAKIREGTYPLVVMLSLLLVSVEVLLSLPFGTPNLAIPSFPAPCTFLPAALCGICAVLCLSVKSFPAVRFIGRYSLYYFLMERWAREAWFSVTDWIKPGFVVNSDNSNLLNLTGSQCLVTLVAIIAIVTMLLPTLRFALSWMHNNLDV